MSKRRVSKDEKVRNLQEIFYEKKEPLTGKEIEKEAKSKGIFEKQVKELIQVLLDDNLLESEKAGVTTIYWSFPSQVANKRKRRLEELETDINRLSTKKQKYEENKANSSAEKETPEYREEVTNQLNQLRKRNQELQNEYKNYEQMDPAKVEQMNSDAQKAKLSANRWTDNIFTLRTYVKNKFSVDNTEVDGQLGIKEDFDYVS